jgi:hypothetical protein
MSSILHCFAPNHVSSQPQIGPIHLVLTEMTVQTKESMAVQWKLQLWRIVRILCTVKAGRRGYFLIPHRKHGLENKSRVGTVKYEDFVYTDTPSRNSRTALSAC